MADVNSLADVIEIAMRKHAVKSGRALAQRAEKAGVPISYTVINQLRAGTYRHDLARDLREALHQLSGVPLQAIDGLAGVTPGSRFELPESADSLLGDQREAVLAVIRAFVKANAQPSTSRRRRQKHATPIVPIPAKKAAHPRPSADPKGATRPK